MADPLNQISVLLRSAKLRLSQAEELATASGIVNARSETDKALLHVETALREIDRKEE